MFLGALLSLEMQSVPFYILHLHLAHYNSKAHGMLPHLGGGVAQGIEDVYILCDLLGHPQTKSSNIEVLTISAVHISSLVTDWVLCRRLFKPTILSGSPGLQMFLCVVGLQELCSRVTGSLGAQTRRPLRD